MTIASPLLFHKIDVIGVITAVSNVGATRTTMRQGESSKRTVTIRLPWLDIYFCSWRLLWLYTNISFPWYNSNAMLDIVLWSERATSFLAEDIHRDGQVSPQIVIFVGTLVKSYGGISLSGGSSCKWYINPDVPEVTNSSTHFFGTCSVLSLLLNELKYLYIIVLTPD